MSVNQGISSTEYIQSINQIRLTELSISGNISVEIEAGKMAGSLL